MPTLLLALVLWAPLARAQALEIPANDGWVTDRAGMLSPEEERSLEALMESYRTGSGREVALLTLPDLGGRPIEEVALQTARAWKIGDRETSSGALLLVAQAERELRIEVGRGLEGTLTDSIAGRIIRDVIVPELRAGRTGAALRAGIEAIHAALGGDHAPLQRTRRARDEGQAFAAALVFLLILVAVARGIRNAGGLGGGGFGGRGSSRRGSALPWLLASQLGRGGGFGRSSGGGGGGFSGFGGGGGFSGGGASGRW